jgi:hypothetical protein
LKKEKKEKRKGASKIGNATKIKTKRRNEKSTKQKKN